MTSTSAVGCPTTSPRAPATSSTELGPRATPCRDGRTAHLVALLEDHLAEVHGGDAVDHGLMRLAEQREAIALDSLDEVHLPEGVASVEWTAHDPRDQVVELAQRAGGRQRGPAHMEGDIEALVVHPDG
jgi:hypothetical protein